MNENPFTLAITSTHPGPPAALASSPDGSAVRSSTPPQHCQIHGAAIAAQVSVLRPRLILPLVLLALGCSGSSHADGSPDASQAGDGSGSGGDAGPPAGDGSANDGEGSVASDAPANASCLGDVPLTYDVLTDRMPYQVAPPALGPAGTIVKDPTYGTSIVRLTDETTLTATTSFRVANEFWGNDWSTDAKLFYMQDSAGAFLPFTFDPTTLAAARVQSQAKPGTPLAMPITAGGFSRTAPTILYGLKGLTIEQFDFASQMTSDVVDLTTIVPGATGNALGVQQGKSGLLVSSFGGPEQDEMPYVVTYDPSGGTHHVVDVTKSTLDGNPIGATIGGGVHSFKVDASGQYVFFSVNGGDAGGSGDWLWDTTAATVAVLPAGGSVGWATWEHGGKGDSYQWDISPFATPSTSTPLITPALSPTDNSASSSVAWETAVGGPSTPLIVETMRQPLDTGPWRAWDDEIIAVRTDGVESEVWRFAHNFNTYSGTIYSDSFYYLFIPRVSQNGWFILFDSNWNGTLGTDSSGSPRTDAFIVALPNPCGP
jgi:hypothetical protein